MQLLERALKLCGTEHYAMLCYAMLCYAMLCRYIAMKLKDQEHALALIDGDRELRDLRHLRAPYLDLEVGRPGRCRGVWGILTRRRLVFGEGASPGKYSTVGGLVPRG